MDYRYRCGGSIDRTNDIQLKKWLPFSNSQEWRLLGVSPHDWGREGSEVAC
jgi:hypothetical protein